MSKKNYAITEIVTNGFGELTEIAILTVDMNTKNITGSFSARVDTKKEKENSLKSQSEPLSDLMNIEEVLPIVMRMLEGKKLASHTGLDFEANYLNKLFYKYYGFSEVIQRINVIDTHVLIMKFFKGTKPGLLEAAKLFDVKATRVNNALLKAYMTYGVLNKIFENGAIRQHTYKYAFKAIAFPKVIVEPIIVEKIVEVEKEVIKEVIVDNIVYVELSFWQTIKKIFTKK